MKPERESERGTRGASEGQGGASERAGEFRSLPGRGFIWMHARSAPLQSGCLQRGSVPGPGLLLRREGGEEEEDERKRADRFPSSAVIAWRMDTCCQEIHITGRYRLDALRVENTSLYVAPPPEDVVYQVQYGNHSFYRPILLQRLGRSKQAVAHNADY